MSEELSVPPPGENATPAEPEMATMTGDWPTHGGYLGCLMGMFIGCVLAGFLSSTLISFIHFAREDARLTFVVSAVAVLILVVALFGRIGWSAGKRFYRDYTVAERSSGGAVLPSSETE